jgi:hypothetical protein
MKRCVCILMCILCIGISAQAVEWQKYVSTDKAFSFHYPKGWKVSPTDSTIEITNQSAKDEQLLIIAFPADKGKTPTDVAKGAVEMIKQSYPDLATSNWRDNDKSSAFHITLTSDGKPNVGDVIVVKEDTSAFWFSYMNLKSAYSDVHSLALLRGLAGSMAAGEDSQPPKDEPAPVKLTAADKARLAKDADAFIFLLEFGLGTPFTSGQEKLIVDELKAGWASLSPEDMATQDTAPTLVKQIMKVDQQHMEPLRQELASKMREWLDATDQNDPAVKMVKNQLNASSKILVDGDPPLPEIAATSYAEMMVFAGMLKKNPNASPSQIPSQSVAAYKAKISKAWNALDSDGKNDALSMPGMWMTIRQVLRVGTTAEQKTIRTSLAKVGGSSQTAASGGSSKSSGSGSSKGSSAVRSMIRHNVMMNIQQQTFNTYMWSRGYSGWTPMGKSW